MKIIIVGCGKVGVTLAEQLNNEGHDIILIDQDSSVLESVTNSIDVLGVAGNGAVYAVQMEAGIEEADLLIATTNSLPSTRSWRLPGRSQGFLNSPQPSRSIPSPRAGWRS